MNGPAMGALTEGKRQACSVLDRFRCQSGSMLGEL